MAAFTPFEPDVKTSTAGFTQQIVIGAANTAQTIVVNQPTATALLVTGLNNSPAGSIPMQAYVRLSVESSTVSASTVSATDTPFVIPAQAETVRLFASPDPNGKYTVSVIVTVSPTGVNPWMLWFTPGEGGVV